GERGRMSAPGAGRLERRSGVGQLALGDLDLAGGNGPDGVQGTEPLEIALGLADGLLRLLLAGAGAGPGQDQRGPRLGDAGEGLGVLKPGEELARADPVSLPDKHFANGARNVCPDAGALERADPAGKDERLGDLSAGNDGDARRGRVEPGHENAQRSEGNHERGREPDDSRVSAVSEGQRRSARYRVWVPWWRIARGGGIGKGEGDAAGWRCGHSETAEASHREFLGPKADGRSGRNAGQPDHVPGWFPFQ